MKQKACSLTNTYKTSHSPTVSSQRKIRKGTDYQYQEWNRGYHFRCCKHKKMVREYYEQLYKHKFDSLDEMDQFL